MVEGRGGIYFTSKSAIFAMQISHLTSLLELESVTQDCDSQRCLTLQLLHTQKSHSFQ